MKKLDDNEILLVYKVEDMKDDLVTYGAEHLKDNNQFMHDLYQRLNKVIDKCDLWSEINECIQTAIDEHKQEDLESNSNEDNRAYNELREREARTYVNQLKN